MMPLRKRFFLLLSLFFGFYFQGLAEETKWVKTVRDGVVLQQKNAKLKVPKNSVFKVVRVENKRIFVQGEIFASKVSGFIARNDLELVAKTTPKKDKRLPSLEKALKKVKYLGVSRSSVFYRALYEKLLESHCYSNLLTKELIPRENIPIVKSIANLSGLEKGDIVALKGILITKKKLCGVKLYNEVYNAQNRLVFLHGKTSGKWRPPEEDYECLAEYRPDLPAPKIKREIFAVFRPVDSKNAVLSEQDFIKTIKNGGTYQILCAYCKGKGKKISSVTKREKNCSQCQGKGLLSAQKSALTIKNK